VSLRRSGWASPVEAEVETVLVAVTAKNSGNENNQL